MDSPDWLNLSADCMEAILRSSSLLVPHEFYLFEALQRWFVNKRKTAEEVELIECLDKVRSVYDYHDSNMLSSTTLKFLSCNKKSFGKKSL